MGRIPKLTCAEWIEKFHRDHLDRGGSESNWLGEYWKCLKYLPPKSALTRDVLHEMVVATQPNTRQRVRACMVANRLAKFAGISYDPMPYRGRYSSKTIKARNLPEDDLIASLWSQIENPGWQWVYAILATYGLRPHEAFRLNFDRIRDGDNVILVLDNTKTGTREVFPYHPEWFDTFQIQSVTLPSLNLERTNESLGRSCSKFFKNYFPLPFKPYDLRHRWAIRTVEYALPDSISAQMMGHSLAVHNGIYHQWITRVVHERAVRATLLNPQRPRPPP